jgi:hypothetical protein
MSIITLREETESSSALLERLDSYTNAGLNKERELAQLLSYLDKLLRDASGIKLVYKHVDAIVDAGIFALTSWENPALLMPSLIGGTLLSGYPMVIYESVSELRMLKIAEDEMRDRQVSSADAAHFLQLCIVKNLAYFASDPGSQVDPYNETNQSLRKRIQVLFEFILSSQAIKPLEKIFEQELKEFLDQRPISVAPIKLMINYVRKNLRYEDSENLTFYVDACFHPTRHSKSAGSRDAYISVLKNMDADDLLEECRMIASSMHNSGLVSVMHYRLIKFLLASNKELLPEALGLNAHGRADFEMRISFIMDILDQHTFEHNCQGIYGLYKMLNRSLLSRKEVYNAFRKLIKARYHPDIKSSLEKQKGPDYKSVLLMDLISVLGQPLGISQGNNPTCQSARGISMWSQHSPVKLINKLIAAITSNELSFRFLGEIFHSKTYLSKSNFDFSLDSVSIALVPHLDDIYKQMMQKAQTRFIGQDPHAVVNPAFYGLWIQTGFISCYNTALNVIEKYDAFAKIFYAAFHPQFNGASKLIYPVPLGIFITNSHAELLGFHAISLLRVAKWEDSYRAYFYNPNNEGRQNWGQGIRTSVSGMGERHGESSLPFHEFLSRVYAYHYNSLEVETHLAFVDTEEIAQVEKLARESWGKKYFWDKN